jgi:hypothetical protein
MKLLSSRRRKAAVAVIIVLLLFLFRPGVSRLKSRIIASISAGVGRNADIGAVHLRLLPRPGFLLENLVVYDDPAFGAEPMLRAGEVTADLRLMSLLRGRLEIARLDLTEPSLNLVHGDNGRWNLEALLERTAHMPLAPTAKTKTERRQEFPYIQATSARINLKSGFEKKPYALTNADFSLWQDSENAWGVRLKAQPLRTDLNLNDTGVLQVNGTWQRAAVFRQTPMDFRLEWSRGQLGQLSKFFLGSDQGWRGGVQLDVAMKGTPAALQITSDASVQDFRRYDITSGDALTAAGHCDGQYSAVDHSFHQIDCKAPVGAGVITLKGDMGLPGSHNFGLALAAENVPASAAAMLARRVKRNLPDDLAASGMVQGSVEIREDVAKDTQVRWEGKGEIAELSLSSAENHAELGPETIPFVLASGNATATKRGTHGGLPAMRVADGRVTEGPRIEVGPFWWGAARTNSPMIRAWIARSGYSAAVAGDADIAKTLRLARMFGVPALQSAAEGTASVDLQVAGAWGYGPQSGFMGPQVTGTAKLRNVRIALRGTSAPVEITAAELQLLGNEVKVGKLAASVADTLWTGSLEMPRGCGVPGACEVHFNLHTNKVALGDLNAWARPSAKERPWYRVLESSPQTVPSFLASLHASGNLSAGHFQIQKFAATQVSADVDLDHGKLRIANLTAEWLGGKHRGTWVADFSASPATCSGSGTLADVSLAGLAENAAWITGTAGGEYQVKGPCSAEFWQAAEGVVQFDVRDGTLPHLSLVENEPGVKILRLWGRARLIGGQFEMKDVWLNSPAGKFQLSGTAGLSRDVELKMTRATGSSGYAISGTLGDPRVTAFPSAEQARLKP